MTRGAGRTGRIPGTMTRTLRIIAALFILASGIVFFALDSSKLFALLLIAGNLFSLAAQWRSDRE